MQLPNDRYRQREDRYVCHDVGHRIADKECIVVDATFRRVMGITIPESGDRPALEDDYQYLGVHVINKSDNISGEGTTHNCDTPGCHKTGEDIDGDADGSSKEPKIEG